MYKSIVGIVFVVDLFDDRPTRTVSEYDFGQTVTVVPGVFFDLAGGRLGLRGSVPFVVEGVGESEPCGGLVVRPCRKASGILVAVGIEAIGLVRLRSVCGAYQLGCPANFVCY